jgi:ankyrin repeat protein
VNGQNNSGETPLHQAVFNLTMSQLMVTHLIKNGANINLANNKGETPLYYAVRMGATQLVSFLIRNGADIGTPKGLIIHSILTFLQFINLLILQYKFQSFFFKMHNENLNYCYFVSHSGATVSPFDVAIEGGFPKIADILKDTKGDISHN